MKAASKDWLQAEPSIWHALADIRSLWRRSRTRFSRVLMLSLLATGAVVGKQATGQRFYESKVVVRVVENDLDAVTSPRPNKRLKEYVLDTVFSNERLFKVMDEHKLYQEKKRKNPLLALETMRDDIVVEVWRNYFVEAREQDGGGRTARLAITYRAPDREEALEVVQHLGRLFQDFEEQGRIAESGRAAKQANDAAQLLKESQVRLRAQLADRQNRLLRASPVQAGPLRVEVQNLMKNIASFETRIGEAQKKAAALELRASMERQHLGLQFEVVDPGALAREGLSRKVQLGVTGLIVFLFSLPLCGLIVGAFDPRVFTAEDIRRMGLRPLGTCSKTAANRS